MVKKISVNTIQTIKDRGEKFSVLTAYDYSTAKYLDEAGIDIILVGDSLAMVALGYNDTRNIGIDEMKIFTKAVSKGVSRAMVITDMPYMSYHTDIKTALENTSLMIKNGATGVKIEGCNEHTLQVVKRCVECGIPVVSHLGFTPQFLNTIGGYNIQGKTYDAALKILEDAQKLQDAGAFAILLEMVPQECAKYITENLRVATISCGAGRYCTGQVLVSDDVFGKYSEFTPRFARKYGDMKSFIVDCAKRFDEDVKSGKFPAEDEVFHADEESRKAMYCR